MILSLIDEAAKSGACINKACRELGLSVRTLQRWGNGKLEDERKKIIIRLQISFHKKNAIT